MRSISYHAWQQAEQRAREAALALQIELAIPGHVPADAMFVHLRLQRQQASEALYALTLDHAHESARLWALRDA